MTALSWPTFTRLVQLVLPLVLILFSESWGTVRNLALRHGDEVAPGRELMALGVANLAAMSITQTVVQLRAPREKKGQVIGVYGVAANGMRMGSGFTVGLLGAVVGLRPALGWSAASLCACVGVLAVYLTVAGRRAAVPSPEPQPAGDAA